jgi:hypothetical protein
MSVTGGDASIVIGGTPTDPAVSVAANGINDAKVANGALSPAKIAGTAATLGPNVFVGNQTITGNLSASGVSATSLSADVGSFAKGGVRGVDDVTLGGSGVYGRAVGSGVFGESPFVGVRGRSVDGVGVMGETGAAHTATDSAVYGLSTGIGGIGVIGEANLGNAWGVYGKSTEGIGVVGTTVAAHTFTKSAVYGLSTGDGGIGIIGEANAGNAWGVYGKSTGGAGVVGESTTGLAGLFRGKVQVNGTTATQILQITGGADLSEGFEVRGANQVAGQVASTAIEPGMVVVIDPKHASKLIVSSTAYDRRAAGVISGAGGIKTGMLMGQSGSVADGDYPVALAGRVYCWADASKGSIEPGDLLTTSSTPGHAMKAVGQRRAQGAIVGKALTGLREGKGLILILVTLR